MDVPPNAAPLAPATVTFIAAGDAVLVGIGWSAAGAVSVGFVAREGGNWVETYHSMLTDPLRLP